MPPPKLLAQLFEIGVDGLADLSAVALRANVDAGTQWEAWHAGSTIKDLAELANHLESRHEAFFDAIDVLKAAAAAELKRREDRWRRRSEIGQTIVH